MADRILISRGTPPIKLVAGKKYKVPAYRDQAYQVVDLEAPAGNAPADPAKLIRDADDLVIEYPDGTQITMTDFYPACTGGACSLTLADGSATGKIVGTTTATIAAGGEGLGFWGWTGIIGGVGGLAAAAGGGGGDEATGVPGAPIYRFEYPHSGGTSRIGYALQLWFESPVVAGTGNIVVSNGTDTHIISVTDSSQVSFSSDAGISVRISPTTGLQPGTQYTVEMAAGVLVDGQTGVAFAGLPSGAWQFEAGTGVSLADVASGSGGFVINGQAASEHSGYSVSGAGDINGDGLADLIVGAPGSSGSDAGRSYVVFGKTGTTSINLSAVAAGVGGFLISGSQSYGQSGSSVASAGDVNGDGLGDLLVGAPGDGTGDSFVVFGKTGTAGINLSALGIDGFTIRGQSFGDRSGFSVSKAGDVNGDGLADLVVGAPDADPAAGSGAGRGYVVFGRAGMSSVNLSDIAAGNGGFVINGRVAGTEIGTDVSAAGDVNGDGLADIIVAGTSADFVVFGKSDSTAVDLSAVAAGGGGFIVAGTGASAASAGDINGDGLADLTVISGGTSYVVFGKTATTAVSLTAVAGGTGGFAILAETELNFSAVTVSAAGDINGDGLADLIIVGEDNGFLSQAGTSYVVFGKTDAAAVQLDAVVAGSGGFLIGGSFGVAASASAGDVNGDGLADIIVGIPNSDSAAGTNAGRSYVIFGSTSADVLQTAVDQLGTNSADTFTDAGTAQTLVTGQGNDTLTATAASVLYGGSGDDTFNINATMITALQSAMGAGGNVSRLARIDGGSGIDTISLTGGGLTFDLTQVANPAGANVDGGSRIDSIERINITGTGNNTLTLAPADVRDMAGMNVFNDGNGWTGLGASVQRHQLVIDGNAGDAITLSGFWGEIGTVSNGGQTYRVYNQAGNATQIIVDADVTANATLVPVLAGSTPADNGVAVALASNIVLTFSKPVIAGTGNIVISNGVDIRTISVADTAQVVISGNTVTINPTANLQINSHYNVQMVSGVLKDADGFPFDGIAGTGGLDFFTLDTNAPTLSSAAPADNASAVAVGSNIVLTFNEAVVAGTGNIVISNGTDIRTISVTDASQVMFSGNTVTINPATNLQANSHYNVQMASGVLKDASGNAYAGITNATALDFSTPDTIAPTFTGFGAPVTGTKFVLAFSENVVAGTGIITINNGIDIRTISITDNTQVSISGNTVTVTPTTVLPSYSGYSLAMDSGTLLDASGNNFAGISAGSPVVFDISVINLSDVAVAGGFVINGQAASDYSGGPVSSAGDVNGDGLADLIIAAANSDPAAGENAGRSYVVFGRTDSTAVDLSAVAAAGGFVINGPSANEKSGYSVSAAGDVDGDGLADLIVGAPFSSGSGLGVGRSYVVFGKTDTADVNLLEVFAGIGGFAINGQVEREESGWSVSSAGDVNGDGLADIVVGAPASDVAGEWSAGRSYVVFGKVNTTAVSLQNIAAGDGGFVINGQAASDQSGVSVSGAGDVNGDGLADLIVGAVYGDSSAGLDVGRSYVVFGRTGTTAINLSAIESGIGGFVMNGQSANDASGYSASSAGDVNGDGLADLVVGAPGFGASDLGRSYVVFGKSTTTSIDLSAIAAGSGGFVISGRSDASLTGEGVSSAGDVNGDGLADLIISSSGYVNPYEYGNPYGAYVVFGKTDTAAIDLSAVGVGRGGFLIAGESQLSVSSAGDVNGDGLADLIVGAPGSDPVAGTDAGRSYVIFGNTSGVFSQTSVDQYGTSGADAYTDGGIAQTLVTGQGDDTLTATAASVLYGGADNDLFVINSTMITALQSAYGSGGNTNQLSRIDGGTGIDTLSLSGSGLTMDLAQIANQAGSNPDGGSRIDSIEQIDLTGTGNNTLVLQLRDVLDMGSANLFEVSGRQQLLVTGDGGDTVDLADGAGVTNWTQAGTASISAVTYNVWNHSGSLATIYVNAAMTVI